MINVFFAGKTVWAVSIPDKPGDNTPTDADVNASVSSGAHPTSCTNTAVAGETNECDIPMANKSYSGSNEDTLGPPPAYSDVFYN